MLFLYQYWCWLHDNFQKEIKSIMRSQRHHSCGFLMFSFSLSLYVQMSKVYTNKFTKQQIEQIIENMDFYCFLCGATFILSKEAIKHLKKIHFIKDNTEPITCIVRNCRKTFNTFSGLSNHAANFNHVEVIQHRINNIIFPN